MNLSVLAVPWRGCQYKKIAEKLLHNLTKRTRPIIKTFLESTVFTINLPKKTLHMQVSVLKFILSSSVPVQLFFKKLQLLI